MHRGRCIIGKSTGIFAFGLIIIASSFSISTSGSEKHFKAASMAIEAQSIRFPRCFKIFTVQFMCQAILFLIMHRDSGLRAFDVKYTFSRSLERLESFSCHTF